MNSTLSRWMLTLILAAAATLAAARDVVLYSSNDVQDVRIATEMLREAYPDVHVKVVKGGTGTLMKRIQAEAASPAGDIFWSGGVGTLLAFANNMEAYRSPEAKAIAPQFRDPGGRHIGVNVHVPVLLVNEAKLNGLLVPRTWSDLMRPEWKGKLVIADPAKSGTAFLQIYGLLKQFGRDGLEKIATNSIMVSGTDQVLAQMVEGRFPVGFTLETRAYKLIAEGKDFRIVYPSEGTYLGPEGMFIIGNARNMAVAKQFYDLLLSKPVQEALLVGAHRRPTRTDIAVSKLTRMPELIDLKVFPLDPKQAADDYDQLIALWNLALNNAKR
jgi:iron(III) transport system substrate-binding protein